MDIILKREGESPFYRQIYEQIVSQILSGTLSANFPLPSIRLIAKELNVSVITVKNAYEQLEQDGYIFTIGGKGSYVKEQPQKREMKKVVTKERLAGEIAYFKSLGMTLAEIVEIVKNLYETKG